MLNIGRFIKELNNASLEVCRVETPNEESPGLLINGQIKDLLM